MPLKKALRPFKQITLVPEAETASRHTASMVLMGILLDGRHRYAQVAQSPRQEESSYAQNHHTGINDRWAGRQRIHDCNRVPGDSFAPS
jgi:hypothetical protein